MLKSKSLPPVLADSPRGSAAWQAWWQAWTAATRDPSLADGIFDSATPELPKPEYVARWQELVAQHPNLHLEWLSPVPHGEPVPPASLSREAVGQLLATFVRPKYRALLADVLLDLLAPGTGWLFAELYGAAQTTEGRSDA